MKTKDIIESGLKSFKTLLNFLEKKIDFDEAEPHKFKGIIEGRKTAFETAVSQLTKIRQLEESEGVFKDSKQKARLAELINSTETVLIEVKKVLEKEIDVDSSDDDKVKAIVQSKSISFDLLLNVTRVRDSIQFKIENNQSLSGSGNRNWITDRAKKK